MKHFLLVINTIGCLLYGGYSLLSQSQIDTLVIEHLKKEIANYQQTLDSLNNQLAEIKKENQQHPYWTTNYAGIVGFDFNSFSQWAARGDQATSSSASVSTAMRGSISLIGEKYFWKNRANLTLGWKKINAANVVEEGFVKTADMLNITSQFGNKINDDLALSVLSEWRSNIFSQSLTPSYLDLSGGMTYSPSSQFNAVIHPINYQFVFSDRDLYQSSFGSKLNINYEQLFSQKVQLISELSSFASFEQFGNLSTFAWNNSLNIRLLDNLGIGVEYAIRVSPQETKVIEVNNDLQTYMVLGLSYSVP